jgi:hypothetical protein
MTQISQALSWLKHVVRKSPTWRGETPPDTNISANPKLFQTCCEWNALKTWRGRDREREREIPLTTSLQGCLFPMYRFLLIFIQASCQKYYDKSLWITGGSFTFQQKLHSYIPNKD